MPHARPSFCLLIDGEPRTLVPLATFRARFDLPSTFAVRRFEPKDTTGMGSIAGQKAAAALNRVADQSVEAANTMSLPTPAAWLNALPGLTRQFEDLLIQHNESIGLRPSEIGFAASGFGDVLTAHAFAHVLAVQRAGEPAPTFAALYQQWLDNSVRLSQQTHEYAHDGERWQVQVIHCAYGRVGLRVQMPDETAYGETAYVEDGMLACPAAAFVERLLARLAEIAEAQWR